MSGRPHDLVELLGELEPGERARLERVHELLARTAGPPELPARLTAAPAVGTSERRPARRPRTPARALAVAAAIAIAAFALGVVSGERLSEPGTWDTVMLTGGAVAPGASATIEVFDLDAAGNWPMELRVRGLAVPADGRRYELWLTRGDELVALCGSFLVDPGDETVVPLNAPWRLDEFDGWVVVEEGSRSPVMTT